ncbi:MAG: hypothetical protein AB7F64_09860, partial [Gammaproteobacteria bacterium]
MLENLRHAQSLIKHLTEEDQDIAESRSVQKLTELLKQLITSIEEHPVPNAEDVQKDYGLYLLTNEQ